MIKLIAIFLLLIFPRISWAEVSFEEVEINGRSALLYSDGSWRFANDEGPICQEIEEGVDVCLNHGDWHPFPNTSLADLKTGYVLFRNGSENIATLKVWSKDELDRLKLLYKGDPILDEAHMKRLIEINGKNLGQKALVIGRSDTKISGMSAKTVVTASGTIKVFTYISQDDLVLFLEVSFPNGTLFTKDKQILHQKLVDAIVIKDQ